ncbi:MAG: efflux RND transporter periplasmic adaptor subunit [Syntrophobacteraceae bacterium]
MKEVRSAVRDPEVETRRPSRFFQVFFGVLFSLLILGALLVFQRHEQLRALARQTHRLAIPTVAVIHPSREAAGEDLVLPGTLQAYVESPIYARTNGYVKAWYHDIGSRVKKGELLAVIETPEVDQQLAQARADLVTAQANLHLARITAARYRGLLKTDAVSKQEVDNANGDLEAKLAIVASSQANVRRLEQLKAFEQIYAPFSGVITRRNVDTGWLINAGNGGALQQLFSLARTDPLRVYVNVPETCAPSVHNGLSAALELAEFPGRRFKGKVVRSAQAIDVKTRTLLTEVDVPNKSGVLLPGSYASVHLKILVSHQRLKVPVNALLFRSEGLRAVVVGGNHRVRLQPLVVGRDYGTSLEVLSGLKPEDWIVLNPPDSIEENEEVHVKKLGNVSTAATSLKKRI